MLATAPRSIGHFVDFNEADAGAAVEAAHLRGVISRRKGDEHDGVEAGGRRGAAGLAQGEGADAGGGGAERGLGGSGGIPVVEFAEEGVATKYFEVRIAERAGEIERRLQERGADGVRDIIRRKPVVAALYETFSALKVKGEDFWNAVGDGTGMSSRNDPRLRLRTSLMSSSTMKGSRSRHMPNEEMYRGCIQAWNAWRDGRELAAIRVSCEGKRLRAK